MIKTVSQKLLNPFWPFEFFCESNYIMLVTFKNSRLWQQQLRQVQRTISTRSRSISKTKNSSLPHL